MSAIIEKIESEQIQQLAEKLKRSLPSFDVGDTVKVHTRVKEGDKERVQMFQGIVIGRKGRGLNEQFTVRRISYGEGVERVFPLHSPRIEKVTVEKKARIRRAKLYYMRNLKGKDATTLRDRDIGAVRGATGKSKKA
jgi:large subunit ribosomal protein L19